MNLLLARTKWFLARELPLILVYYLKCKIKHLRPCVYLFEKSLLERERVEEKNTSWTVSVRTCSITNVLLQLTRPKKIKSTLRTLISALSSHYLEWSRSLRKNKMKPTLLHNLVLAKSAPDSQIMFKSTEMWIFNFSIFLKYDRWQMQHVSCLYIKAGTKNDTDVWPSSKKKKK